MKIVVKPPKETFCDADWVSHIRLLTKEVGELVPGSPQGIENIRYEVEHVEVFKKPTDVDALSTEIFGSSLGDLRLEEGKEYLLCGRVKDGKLSCAACGQVKPEEVYLLVAEWNEIPASFIEEMKNFE
ncbi:hypothetical protein PMAYCL1PPCAC_17103 [Pristionchus mayeri]|uniref:NTR domain-containing protein n=1 Tax=Pristionchus mayeri TaxID=1317129 RepID=A0AAN5CM15_9BILA|nr:hypothetical protein PMAYCL1PPCAC_17103 [Pristionchus mayeri]